MASRRYRRNTSVGTRLIGLEEDAKDSKKQSGLATGEVHPENFAENSVERAAISPNAVGATEIDNGAVGTEHLGIVNEIKTDGALVLSGPTYSPSGAGVSYPLVMNSLGQVVPSSTSTANNKIINGDFRINQREYVSATPLTPGLLSGYCFDRWKTAGIANLAINSRGATASTGWSGTNSTISRLTGLTIPGLTGVTTAIRGTQIAAVTGGLYFPSDAGVQPILEVKNSNIYRISAWLRSSVAKTIQPSAQFFNAAGAQTGSRNAASTVALAANTWTLVSWLCLPVEASTRMGPFWYSTAAWAVGNTLDVTGVIITEGPAVVDYFDGNMTGNHFVGTTNMSTSINRAVRTTVTFTSSTQGQPVTINSGGAIQQIIERAEVPAGDYTLAWEGTAGAAILATDGSVIASSATSPLVWNNTGIGDRTIEFAAVGGTKTLDHVSLAPGTAAEQFVSRLYTDELLLCQRFYIRWTGDSISSRMTGYGVQPSTSTGEIAMQLPVSMRPAHTALGSRGRIVMDFSNIQWTDGSSFNQVCNYLANSTSDYLFNAGQAVSISVLLATVQGAGLRPGVISASAAGGWLALSGEFY